MDSEQNYTGIIGGSTHWLILTDYQNFLLVAKPDGKILFSKKLDTPITAGELVHTVSDTYLIVLATVSKNIQVFSLDTSSISKNWLLIHLSLLGIKSKGLSSLWNSTLASSSNKSQWFIPISRLENTI